MAKFITRLENPAPQWRYIPNVVYHRYGTLERSLQMVVPCAPNQRLPLIVYLPGSAFYEQEMYSHIPNFGRLAERGFVVAGLQYRQSQLAKFPAQVVDVHNALAFLTENAAQFGIDPENIFLMGHSSGGYNALMGALSAGLSEFDGGKTHTVRAVAALAAPCCLKFEMGMTVPGKVSYNPDDFRPELDMLGLARFEDDPALCLRARPDTYVRADRDIPPVLLVHGDADETVCVNNSRDFYDSLCACGKTADFHVLPGLGHGGSWLFDNAHLDIVESFFRRYIK